MDLWKSIAAKLHLTEEEAMMLHAFNRGWTNTLARRKVYLVVNRIVEEFLLDDRNFADSYAAQLFVRGTLTSEEAQLFSGNVRGKDQGIQRGEIREIEAISSGESRQLPEVSRSDKRSAICTMTSSELTH